MSAEDQSVLFNRPPRIQLPDLPEETIEIPAPPALAPAPNTSWLVAIIPFAGIGVMALFYALRTSDNSNTLFTALPLMVLAILTLAGTVITRRRQAQQYQRQQDESLLNYIRALDTRRVRLQAAYDAQMAILNLGFPSPQSGLSPIITSQTQLWERRPEDVDFAAFRLGSGDVPSRIRVQVADTDLESNEITRAFTLAETYRLLRDAPVVVPLQQVGSVGMCGARESLLSLMRAALCGLACAHTPQDLHIHLIAPGTAHEDWRWMEWLPHTSYTHQGGAGDLMAFESSRIHNLLGTLSQIVDERRERPDLARAPHLLLVVDSPALVESEAVYTTVLREGHFLGVSVICLVGTLEQIPGDCRAVVEIRDDGSFRYAQTGAATGEIPGRAVDILLLQDTESIARALSSVTLRDVGMSGRIPRRVDFLDLYGLRDLQELPTLLAGRWRRTIPRGVLPHPVPIGRESLTANTELLLDEDHHGPHGVLAGTTGSGKSELLQTLVCALALEHDPRLLNLLLIDFKGGSTFNVFANLPHTVGMLTNLDGMLVERALEALKAEVRYRQQFLKKMNVRDVTQYHRFFARTEAHVQDPSYEALPHLFIIVDEFAQLAREMPDFLHELVRIAQVGRSLGLHLILGTQSPMDVITDEMNANLQFRICLRVQNIEASRAMLRRPDAAYLPAGWPGRGYFQVGERGLFKQFQTAYAGGDYQHREDGEAEEPAVLELVLESGETIDLLSQWKPALESALSDEPYTTARAVAEVVINFARDSLIHAAPPLLLPPLEDRLSLNAVFRRAVVGGWNGLAWFPPMQDERSVQPGSAPIGLLDDIYSRTQDALWVHLNTGEQDTSRDGHLLIVGGPGSGKTTLLRTLAMSEAILHPPERLHMYFLSLTGSGLNDLEQLPHAERVVQGTETERVRRLFGRLIHTLEERQAGRAPSEPTILLFIDQYEQFRDSFYDQHTADFERLINEGRGVGIYLVVTASSMSAIPERLRSLVQQRIALQLGNAGDYPLAVGAVQMRLEGQLPKGRGFIAHNPPLMTQIALPCLEMTVDDAEALAAMRETIHEMRAARRDEQSPAPIRELPTRIGFELSPSPNPSSLASQWRGEQDRAGHGLSLQDSSRISTPIGRLDDDALSLYTLDWWESGPHFVVIGPAGSGKTNLLQLAVLTAAQQYSPDDLRVLLVDFNGRSLRALAGLKHVIAHITNVTEFQEQLACLDAELKAFYERWREERDVKLPKTVILIDDYDVTAEMLGAQGAFLQRLRDHLRLHSEQGLHLWAAGYLERTSDPLIRQLLLKRSGFGLSVRESLHPLNIRTAGLSAEPMPEGRAYFVEHNTIQVIQTALVENPAQVVASINEAMWPHAERAHWLTDNDLPQPPAPPAADSRLSIDVDGLLDDLLGGDHS
jgi:S-DNA-T family DNA segregation ATPase FtsK/SpoIIIE